MQELNNGIGLIIQLIFSLAALGALGFVIIKIVSMLDREGTFLDTWKDELRDVMEKAGVGQGITSNEAKELSESIKKLGRFDRSITEIEEQIEGVNSSLNSFALLANGVLDSYTKAVKTLKAIREALAIIGDKDNKDNNGLNSCLEECPDSSITNLFNSAYEKLPLQLKIIRTALEAAEGQYKTEVTSYYQDAEILYNDVARVRKIYLSVLRGYENEVINAEMVRIEGNLDNLHQTA